MTQARKRPSSALPLNDERDVPRWIRTARQRQPRSTDKDKVGLLIREQYLRLFDQGKTVEDHRERIT